MALNLKQCVSFYNLEKLIVFLQETLVILSLSCSARVKGFVHFLLAISSNALVYTRDPVSQNFFVKTFSSSLHCSLCAPQMQLTDLYAIFFCYSPQSSYTTNTHTHTKLMCASSCFVIPFLFVVNYFGSSQNWIAENCVTYWNKKYTLPVYKLEIVNFLTFPILIIS